MMFADQNFDIEAEFPRLSQDFHDAAGGRNAGLRKSDDFNIYDCAFQFGQAHRLSRGIFFDFVLGGELRGQFFA